jgi:hypothetical protein
MIIFKFACLCYPGTTTTVSSVSLKQDMLNHRELLELNATLAFEATIWRKQPSNHCVLLVVGNPTKNV